MRRSRRSRAQLAFSSCRVADRHGQERAAGASASAQSEHIRGAVRGWKRLAWSRSFGGPCAIHGVDDPVVSRKLIDLEARDPVPVPVRIEEERVRSALSRTEHDRLGDQDHLARGLISPYPLVRLLLLDDEARRASPAPAEVDRMIRGVRVGCSDPELIACDPVLRALGTQGDRRVLLRAPVPRASSAPDQKEDQEPPNRCANATWKPILRSTLYRRTCVGSLDRPAQTEACARRRPGRPPGALHPRAADVVGGTRAGRLCRCG